MLIVAGDEATIATDTRMNENGHQNQARYARFVSCGHNDTLFVNDTAINLLIHAYNNKHSTLLWPSLQIKRI